MTRRGTNGLSGAARRMAAAGRCSTHRLVAAFAFGLVLLGPGVPVSAEDGVTYPRAAQLYDGGQIAAAVAAFRQLAEDGNVAAQVTLAGLYENGEVGQAPDHAAAARWYQTAAQAGNALAQMNLGDLYARGRGVERDLVQAWVWLSRAAGQGRDWAARRREEIAARMRDAQLAQARKLLAAESGDTIR